LLYKVGVKVTTWCFTNAVGSNATKHSDTHA